MRAPDVSAMLVVGALVLYQYRVQRAERAEEARAFAELRRDLTGLGFS